MDERLVTREWQITLSHRRIKRILQRTVTTMFPAAGSAVAVVNCTSQSPTPPTIRKSRSVEMLVNALCASARGRSFAKIRTASAAHQPRRGLPRRLCRRGLLAPAAGVCATAARAPRAIRDAAGVASLRSPQRFRCTVNPTSSASAPEPPQPKARPRGTKCTCSAGSRIARPLSRRRPGT